jgi:hypothetical protein
VLELLRPPPHRGPLIAAGAVLLATGLAVAEFRLDDLALGVHLLILAVPAAVVLALGLQAPNEEGRPPAYQSVLLVTGLLLLAAALYRLADVLGADFDDDFVDGALVWTGLVLAGAALWAAVSRRSAICLLIAAIAATIALLSAWEWIFDPAGVTATRWLLLVVAIALAIGSLALRERAPRHAEVLVVGAGLAILAIGLQAILGTLFDPGDEILTGFWELVVLAAGCGLVAFGAIDRSPGPAWLGVANLAAFVFSAQVGDATLYWWPFLLIVLGAAAMIAGLRPRQPLPPEPDAYPARDRPLASRAADDEVVLRVRDDTAP